MATFAFPLPTTGALLFSSFLLDPTNQYDQDLTQASNSRASLRGTLKAEKRERDSLAVLNVVECYLPFWISIGNCLKVDDLLLANEPDFSWRVTLTQTLHPNPSRLSFPSFFAEEAFVLLTYTYALSNLSSSILLSLSSSGAYELDQTLPTAERKKKDERLGQAADLLCRAAGVAEYVAENVLGRWERERVQKGGGGKGKSPVEGSKSFALGLSKMLLADAQLLSIRKLLSPSLSSNPHPGPPLAKTHPSSSLLSKLYLNVLSLYTLAHTLLLSSSSSTTLKSSPLTSTDPPLDELVKYVREGRLFAEAASRKWLGVDAGESNDPRRIGEAIVWLRDARRILDEGPEKRIKVGGAAGLFKKDKGKEERKERRNKWTDEHASVEAFLRAYEKANNTVYFTPIPTLSSLLPRIPAGRAVLNLKPFVPPPPAFGPGSPHYVSRNGANVEAALDKLSLKSPDNASAGYY